MSSHEVNFGTEAGTIGGPNIRAVMIKDNRILLKQGEENYWITPGGGPTFGETTQDALGRHIKQKCGFEIEQKEEGVLSFWQGGKYRNKCFWLLFGHPDGTP